MELDVSFEKPILVNLEKITQEKFDALCAQHVCGIVGAAHNDFLSISDVDLSDINLDYLNLGFVVFTRVKFPDSIRFSNMYGVKFDHCDLSHCCIDYCNFGSVSFNCCTLYNSRWRYTNMLNWRADYSYLCELELTGCVCSMVKWWCSQISLDSYSITSGSNDISADIIKMCDPAVHVNQQCPTHGRFIGWKKVLAADPDTHEYRVVCICKLEIPASARRSSSLGSKCRADKAKVLEIRSISDGCKFKAAASQWDPSFIYRVGEYVSVDNFDENRYNECAPGIHFFIDKQAALDY